MHPLKNEDLHYIDKIKLQYDRIAHHENQRLTFSNLVMTITTTLLTILVRISNLKYALPFISAETLAGNPGPWLFGCQCRIIAGVTSPVCCASLKTSINTEVLVAFFMYITAKVFSRLLPRGTNNGNFILLRQ